MPPVSPTVTEVEGEQVEELVPLLLLAEPSERGLRWGLAHLVDSVYRVDEQELLVGAATMRWRDDPCELQELAVAPEVQGRGYGRFIVEWLIEEARTRGRRRMLVGTANSSIANIAFYQKCGFRMDHVRHDYFGYYREPIYENGIRMRDMLVFRYDLQAQGSRTR